MTKKELERFARQNPDFVAWAKSQRQKVRALARQRNYELIVQEWEKSKQSESAQRKLMAHQIAQSMRDVKNFIQNVESVFTKIKTLHGYAKNLKR
ncbi:MULTISPECIES: hypothetical protein [Aneurinibacillus]|uniref:Uncharacterized protein n=1 Tax=Aneurinibacillus thermoaerophilus TaxID=143495 RepID=A0A1G8ATW4_ANETH|nr:MULTISPECIES: hypothetical protein [Aneurinibacillus]AMA72841.1 hypothetical protein ACH33_08230 [Aneurinibacillus sp. XH2]MED0675228.1 hypothetical protein [Aneurinibacillus thermoaerophilus]MED0738166.1 hypothetical protein [Aneurinibacillus thermoaerophilus]MED0758216.1 hypothetical protein [Aneurinibacillus thermoaerophilus]MED0761370.1 hypothetical protein [Aneurinibacillus thermoaerophilus]